MQLQHFEFLAFEILTSQERYVPLVARPRSQIRVSEDAPFECPLVCIVLNCGKFPGWSACVAQMQSCLGRHSSSWSARPHQSCCQLRDTRTLHLSHKPFTDSAQNRDLLWSIHFKGSARITHPEPEYEHDSLYHIYCNACSATLSCCEQTGCCS